MTMVWLSIGLWLVIEMVLVVLACRPAAKCECCNPFTDPVTTDDDIRFVCVVKGRERYIFLFSDTPARKMDVIDTAERFAADVELSFTDKDAEVVAMQLAHMEWAD